VIELVRNGCPLVAVNHDSFLFDVHRADLPRLKMAVDAILGQVADRLFPGAPMKWDPVVYEDRYRDEKGEKLWKRIKTLIGQVRSYA
jgi:hypothetical protein